MISIIIPTLNEEKILEQTLRSLREYKGEYEIIISDGKSTDHTIEIARKYAHKVVIYEGEKRQTIGMGRNLGAKSASGDLLIFLDADMYIPHINEFFAQAIHHFSVNKRLVGLGVFLGVTKNAAKFSDSFFLWIFNWIFYISNNIFHSGVLPGEFQMVRRETFEKLGGYNETLAVGEDNEFFKRLSRVGDTRIDSTLKALHPLRRAHKVGWIHLIGIWGINHFVMTFFKRSHQDVWEEVR